MDKVYKEKWRKMRVAFLLSLFTNGLLLLANIDYHHLNDNLTENNQIYLANETTAKNMLETCEANLKVKEIELQNAVTPQ